MRRRMFVSAIVFIALVLAAGACSDTERTPSAASDTGSPTAQGTINPAMVGTYTCAPEPRPTDPNWGGPETWILAQSGKLTTSSASGANAEGTWRGEGNQIIVRLGVSDDRFDIDGSKFVGVRTHPGGGKFTCNKQA